MYNIYKMSSNIVNHSNNRRPIDVNAIKDVLNCDKKTWWNTRAGYIIKTTYDTNNRTFHESNLPYNIVPDGIPIKFASNKIPHDS